MHNPQSLQFDVEVQFYPDSLFIKYERNLYRTFIITEIIR